MLKTPIAILALVSAASSAAAPPLQDLDALDAQIAGALGPGATALPIDRRLRLLACAQPPAIEASPRGDGLTLVCASRGWRLFVAFDTQRQTESAIVIRRGDLIELVYQGSGFDIATTATALEDGRIGGALRVKTSTSGAIVTARVRAAGSATVGG